MSIKTAFAILLDCKTNWLGKPSKIFDSIDNRNVLEVLLEQTRQFHLPIYLSVMDQSDEIIANLQSYEDVEIIYSNALNESQRLLEIFERFDLDIAIRLSGDNPILGAELVSEGLGLMQTNDFIFTYGYPVGINIEFINRRTVERCNESESNKRVREIVCTDLYDQSRIEYLQAKGMLNRPEVRWTTGSSKDFQTTKELLNTVRADSPEIPELNSLINSYNQIMVNHLPMPTMVNIEPTNKCNLKCIMCPRDEMERTLGVMELDVYKKVIDQCVESGVTQITLNGYGEPFIAKQIFEMIDYTMRSSLNLKINTNGHYLNSKNIEKLLDNPPHHLSISLDGATKETYEKVRVNGRFERLMSNLEALLIAREKRGNHSMKITLQIIRMDETEQEIEDFVNQWKDRVDEISIPNVHNWGGQFEEAGNLSKMKVDRFPCKELWRTMMVFQDGSTSICCAVFDNNMNMGNINNQHLSDIWQSENYNQLRQHHLDGNYHLIDICKDCNMWKAYG